MLAMKRVEVVMMRGYKQLAIAASKPQLVDVTVVTQNGDRTEYGYLLKPRRRTGWQVQGVMPPFRTDTTSLYDDRGRLNAALVRSRPCSEGSR